MSDGWSMGSQYKSRPRPWQWRLTRRFFIVAKTDSQKLSRQTELDLIWLWTEQQCCSTRYLTHFAPDICLLLLLLVNAISHVRTLSWHELVFQVGWEMYQEYENLKKNKLKAENECLSFRNRNKLSESLFMLINVCYLSRNRKLSWSGRLSVTNRNKCVYWD